MQTNACPGCGENIKVTLKKIHTCSCPRPCRDPKAIERFAGKVTTCPTCSRFASQDWFAEHRKRCSVTSLPLSSSTKRENTGTNCISGNHPTPPVRTSAVTFEPVDGDRC